MAIDVAAATGLLRRVLIGDELTDKEKKALQRTLTDLAAVVPIGVLMLLPVRSLFSCSFLKSSFNTSNDIVEFMNLGTSKIFIWFVTCLIRKFSLVSFGTMLALV